MSFPPLAGAVKTQADLMSELLNGMALCNEVTPEYVGARDKQKGCGRGDKILN